MADGLQIKIGADVGQAIAGLKQVETASIKTASGISKLSPAVKTANTSLLGVSRVLQDLPYGFQGIANNITELPNAFKSLSASAKEAGTSVGSVLLKSLTGAGGIGIALSAITTAVTFASIGFGSWTRILGGAGKAAKEAADEQKKYNDSVQSAIKSVADEAAKVAGLVNYIELETTSKKERINAIKELQAISPSYFATLDAEKASIGQVTAAYNIYLLSLRRAVEAKVTEKQLSDVIERRLELEKKLNKPLFEQIMLNGRLVTVRNAVYDADGTVKKQQEELVQLKKDELILANKLGQLKPPQITKPEKVNTDSFTDAERRIIAFAKQIQSAFSTDLKIKFDVLDDDKTVLDKAKKTVNSLNNFFAKPDNLLTLKINAEVDEIKPPPDDETKVKAGEFGQVFYNELKSYFKRVEPIDVSLIKAVEDYKKIEDLAKGLGAAFDNLKQTVVADGVSGIAEGIGEALAGGDVGSAFKAFGNVIASAVTEMGKQFIKLGTAALLAKKAITKLFANPALAIAAGAGLVVLGSALRTAMSGNFGGFRAMGGPVGAGKGYIVGERGPEWFQPDVGGRIIPNNQISPFMGGGSSSPFITRDRQYIRGNNLVLVTARTNRSQSRLG